MLVSFLDIQLIVREFLRSVASSEGLERRWNQPGSHGEDFRGPFLMAILARGHGREFKKQRD